MSTPTRRVAVEHGHPSRVVLQHLGERLLERRVPGHPRLEPAGSLAHRPGTGEAVDPDPAVQVVLVVEDDGARGHPTLCSRAAANASRSSRWSTGGCSRSSSWIGVTPSRLSPRSDAHEVGDEVGGRRPEDGGRGVVLLEVPALAQDRDPVAEPHGLLDVVGDEDDGLVQLVLEPQELALQPLAGDRVDRAERLVHEQDRRVRRQRPRHADPLSLAAGELVRVAGAVRPRVEPDELEQLADPRPAPSFDQPSRCGTVATFCAIVWCGNSPTCWMT